MALEQIPKIGQIGRIRSNPTHCYYTLRRETHVGVFQIDLELQRTYRKIDNVFP